MENTQNLTKSLPERFPIALGRQATMDNGKSRADRLLCHESTQAIISQTANAPTVWRHFKKCDRELADWKSAALIFENVRKSVIIFNNFEKN